MTMNGLAALDNDQANKRQQRARHVPPSAKGRLTIPPDPPSSPTTDASTRTVVQAQEAPVVTHEAPLEAVHRPGGLGGDASVAQQADDGPLRAAQVYFDGTTDDHLRRIRAAALVGGSDVTNSAVVRRAVAELVERHGHDGIVALLSDDPRTRRGRGRPRR